MRFGPIDQGAAAGETAFMKVLLIGSGGREHSLAWKLSQSPLVRDIIAAPGKPGIARHARLAPIRMDEVAALAGLSVAEHIDLAVIGPEAPLTLLHEAPAPVFHSGAAVAIVYAASGYPEAPQRGSVIRGVQAAEALPGVQNFHAGTKQTVDGILLADGGRVLNICARGATLREAIERAYGAVTSIDWPQGFFRRDIAARGLVQ